MSVAVHEAGHAIVGRALCSGPIRAQVGLRPARKGLPRGTAGTVQHAAPAALRGADVAQLYRELAVILGGPLAEVLAGGRHPLATKLTSLEVANNALERERAAEPLRDGSYAKDSREWALRTLVDKHGYRDEVAANVALDTLAVAALHRATRILNDHWPELERLAEQLEADNEATI